MAIFWEHVTDNLRNPFFLREAAEKFHYEEKHLTELQAVAEQMFPLVRKEAFWARQKSCVLNAGNDTAVAYEDVAMTLGGSLDRLQENYTQKGLLCECYMSEVLASELLLQAYQSYNQFIRQNTPWHVARYHFPGSGKRILLEQIPLMLENLTPLVTCNEAFCMLPKKSVVFTAELTLDKEVQCEGICVSCKSINCPNRITDSQSFIPSLIPPVVCTR